MAFDAEELATRARERITEMSEGVSGVTIPHLMSLINDARRRLVDRLAEENDGEYQYTKTFETQPGDAGIVDVSDLVAGNEPLLLEALKGAYPQGRVYIGGYNYQLRVMPDRDSLRIDASKVPSCAVEDQKLYVKGRDGRVDSFAATASISAPYVPALANIRTADQPKIVDELANLGLASVKSSKRPPASPNPTTPAA